MFYENKKCLFITVIVIVFCNKVNSFPHGHRQNNLPFNSGERRGPEPDLANNPFFFKPPRTGFQPFDPRFIQDKLRSFTPHGYLKPDFDASNILPNFNLHGNHHNHPHDRRPTEEENVAINNFELNYAMGSNPTGALSDSGFQKAKDPLNNDNVPMTVATLRDQSKPSVTGNDKFQSEPLKPPKTTAVETNAEKMSSKNINQQIELTEVFTAVQTTNANISSSSDTRSKVVEIDDNDFGSQFLNNKSGTEPSTQETTTDLTTTEVSELTTDDDIFNRMGGVPSGVVASLLG